MRLLLLLLLAACDLQPAPKKAPPAPLPTTPGDAGAAVTARADATGVAVPDQTAVRPAVDAAMEVTDACVAAGTHLAEVVIAGAVDVAQKAAYEQQRTQMVRKVAENCTRDAWTDEIRGCIGRATDTPGLQECFKLLKPNTP